jgi:foldase protein PrsA
MSQQKNRARQVQGAQTDAQNEKQNDTQNNKQGASDAGMQLPLSKKVFISVSVVVILAAFGIGILCGKFIQLPSPSLANDASGDAALGGIAATVGDTQILESEIANYIATTMRVDSSTGETMNDEDWASYLQSNSWTPETLREAVIRNVFAMPQIIVNAAEELGIEADETSIQSQLEEQRESVGEDSWDQWLADNGYRDEAAFILELTASDVYSELMAANSQTADPTTEEIDAYVGENAASYAGQRISGIYLPYDSDEGDGDTAEAARAKADEALSRIRAGEDFAAVADEYNTPGTTDVGGDIGWGMSSYLSEECTAALETMTVSDVSDVIDTGSALFILKVTDEYILPESGEVEVDLVPVSLRELLADELADSNSSQAQSDYYGTLVESDLVIIYPMPEGLPYDVDMG